MQDKRPQVKPYNQHGKKGYKSVFAQGPDDRLTAFQPLIPVAEFDAASRLFVVNTQEAPVAGRPIAPYLPSDDLGELVRLAHILQKPVLLTGEPGSGKTQLAKVLAKELFDSEDALVRIDMSEYMEKFAISRLVGAPPGYVGYEEGGQLTEKVRRKPYCVVLLDEIEKAHPDVFNMLLQVLDDGYLTDSLGRKIDFKNTIIIMTSNVGARQLKDFGQGVGFGTAAKVAQTDENSKSIIENALKKTFAPEFLNRIDDVIVFNALEKHDIDLIIEIELKKLIARVADLGYQLALSAEAKSFIAEKGFDKQFGARPLKRAIQKYVEDALAEEIITAKIGQGDEIFMDLDAEKQELTVAIKKLENPIN